MDIEKIKEFQLKMEGVADGIKFGVNQTLQWVVGEFAKEAPKPSASEGTPPAESQSN